MPVNTPHASYAASAALWQRLRDCIAGEDSVKAEGPRYLPRLGGQSDEDYKSYLCRASFYGATGRTHEGIAGAMWRKAPTVAVPGGFEERLSSVTLDGLSFEHFARFVVREVLAVARYGVLVDFDSKAVRAHLVDFDSKAVRAHLAGYTAESIVNWRTETRAGQTRLSRVVLRESYEEPGDDEFEIETREQYRVLELAEGVYQQRVFRKIEVQSREGVREEWRLVETIVPTINGTPWDAIPFLFFGPSDLTPEIAKPPLSDLASANLKHYVCDAEIAHGLHFCALPTPVVAGGRLNDRTENLPDGRYRQAPALKIGPGEIWDLPEGATWGYLQPGSGWVEPYRTRQASLEDQMVHLGAQILQSQKAAAETAEAMRLRSSGESSILSMIADACSQGLEIVLGWLVLWEGGDAEAVSVRLNKDFLESRMDPQELAALVRAWQDGALSDEALVYNLVAGELLPPDTDPEEYLAALERPAPAPAFPPPFAQPEAAPMEAPMAPEAPPQPRG